MPDYPELDAYNSATAYGQPHRLKNAVIELADAMRDELLARIAALEAELEIERGRLAACGVAALGYFDGCQDEYRSASLEDVLKLRSDFDAEREKRCGTCGHRVWLGWRWTCPRLQAVISASTEDAVEVPDDFGCTEYEPAEQGGKDE